MTSIIDCYTHILDTQMLLIFIFTILRSQWSKLSKIPPSYFSFCIEVLNHETIISDFFEFADFITPPPPEHRDSVAAQSWAQWWWAPLVVFLLVLLRVVQSRSKVFLSLRFASQGWRSLN